MCHLYECNFALHGKTSLMNFSVSTDGCCQICYVVTSKHNNCYLTDNLNGVMYTLILTLLQVTELLYIAAAVD